MNSVKRILFPIDFSDCAESAFVHARQLAERFGANLDVLHVADDPDARHQVGALRITLANLADQLRMPTPAPETTPPRSLVENEVTARASGPAILQYEAENDIDLIVMGAHGRSAPTRWKTGSVAEAFLGSVPDAMDRRRPCPSYEGSATSEREHTYDVASTSGIARGIADPRTVRLAA